MLGWIFFVVLGGLMIKGLDYGMGIDLWNVSKAKHARFTKVSSLGDALFEFAILNLRNFPSSSIISRLSHELGCFSPKLPLSFYINASSFPMGLAGPASGGPSGSPSGGIYCTLSPSFWQSLSNASAKMPWSLRASNVWTNTLF